MKRIGMAGELVITDDRLADAILEYARALARAGTADTVTFPVVGADGDVEQASMLLGPASQMVLTEADDAVVDLPVDDALEDVRRRHAQLVHPGGSTAPEGPDEDNPFLAFDDYLN